MSNRYRGQVDVPALGEGYYLRLTWNDMAALSDKDALGEGYFLSALDLCEAITMGIASATQKFMVVLKHALRNADGKKLSASEFDALIDETDATPLDLASPLQEALCLAARGQTAEEFKAFAEKQQRDLEKAMAEGKENPTKAARKTS